MMDLFQKIRGLVTALLIGIPLFSMGNSAQDTLVLSSDEDVLFWEFETQAFLDTTGTLAFEDVAFLPFHPFSEEKHHHFAQTNVLWFRSTIKNSTEKDWLLEFPDAHLTSVQVFRMKEGGTWEIFPEVGGGLPSREKIIPHKNQVFPLGLSVGASATYLMRVALDKPSSPMFHLRSVPFYFGYATVEYYFLGSYYGMIVIMIVYGFMLFLSTRQVLYLHYVVYLLGCSLLTMGEDLSGAHIFWPEVSWPNALFHQYGHFFWLVGFLLFANAFLQVHITHRLLTLIALLAVLGTGLSQVFYWNVHHYFILLSVGMALWQGLKQYFSGVRYARYFTVGYAAIFVGFIVYTLRFEQWIGVTPFNYYSTYGAFVIEMLVFALAMSDRIRQIRKEKERAQQEVITQLKLNEELKDKVNRELEQKVADRTKELNVQQEALREANDRLNVLSEELQRMNASMDKENWELQREIKAEKRKKLESHVLNFEAFQEVFPDNLSCLKYLAEKKWSDTYVCRKCGHGSYMKGEKHHSRKCTRCKYDESPTSGTLFQGVRFDLAKAFFIAYHTIESKEKVTIDQLSEMLELRRNTCWSFKKKVEAKAKETGLKHWKELIL